MENLSLYKSLIAYQKKKYSSFHTPGHKNRYIEKKLLKLDLTELIETDNLFDPKGCILELEKKTTKLFSTKRTLISAGGCTLCIQAMLKLCCNKNRKIILGRVIHKSAINTLALLGIEPVWVYPRADAGIGYPGRIHPDDIKKAITKNPDAAAVYITSPDYYGVICDIKSISMICKQFNIPLLVDNAHGSHLGFIDKNLDPINCGANLVASSAHKTLPVLTGGAWLHICDSSYIESAKEAMSLFGSTSPSYPIMASLDLCIDWLLKNKDSAFNKLKKQVVAINHIAQKKGIEFPLGLRDPLRLCFNTQQIGMTGIETAKFFRKYKIEVEHCDYYSTILIPTPLNTKTDFLRLKKAIMSLPISKSLKIDETNTYLAKPEMILLPREAIFAKSEYVSIKNSLGKIAAEATCTCPPGMPVVMPGEKINSNQISFLFKYGISKIKVVK